MDLIINGEIPDFLAKKVKLADEGLTPDEVVRKRREELKKSEENEE